MPIIIQLIVIFANNLANLYNNFMEFNAKDIIKLLLSKESLTQKELAIMLTNKTDKKYTPDGLSRKLNKGTITFNEISKIINILGYEIKIEKK